MVGRELRTWDGERGTVWEGLNIGSSFYIKEDSLCWLDGCDLHVYNLVSGQDQVNTLGSDDTGNFIVFDGQYYDLRIPRKSSRHNFSITIIFSRLVIPPKKSAFPQN